jgi:hypothetical protein
MAWIRDTIKVTTTPAPGPNKNAAIKAGTSPGSYSKNGAAGIKGNLIKNINTTARAESIVILTRFLTPFFI